MKFGIGVRYDVKEVLVCYWVVCVIYEFFLCFFWGENLGEIFVLKKLMLVLKSVCDLLRK